MPMISAFWNKLNGNEKFVGYGAVLVVIAFLAATAGGRSGDVTTSLVGVIIVFAIFWLKYSTMKIPWPVPISTVVLGVTAILTVLALLNLLPALSAITQLYGIALLLNLIGCGVMAFGAYKEYQTTVPKATPPAA